MDQKLLNKAITISAKEEKIQGGKPVVKLKDEKGLTYTVYKTKQDGSTSVAWTELQKLSLGQTVQIGYVEDIKDSPEYGKVTYRTIRNFNADIGNGVQNSLNQGKDPYRSKYRATESSSEGSSPVKDSAFWERQAYEKCCSLWMASDLQKVDFEQVLGYLRNDKYWVLFQAIKADGAKRFYPGPLNGPNLELPVINQGEDFDDLGESVPF